MADAVILEAVRTPFGRRNGAFRETQPHLLLSHALQGLLHRSKVPGEKIEDVVTGCVSPVNEQGANIGRVAALHAELPIKVPAVTLNRMCGSSQQAVHFASQAVAAGDMNYVIASGVENMTRVTMGSDFMGVIDVYPPRQLQGHDVVHQGDSAERIAVKWNITRADCDEYSAESHRRASEAIKANKLNEILQTRGIDSEGAAIKLSRDEGVRDTIDKAKMGKLPTVFKPEGGVVTAGNSSQISDGASAVLIANREVAIADGYKPKARFLSRVAVGDNPTLQLTAVIPATKLALEKAKLTIKDIDWIEINEAFATVVLSWAKEIKPNMEKVNPWGGAIAHGHPLGATGAGLMAKMVNGLEQTGGRLGLQVMCIGHGMATCTIIERIA